jgi:4-nitrophenyl phosphatase
MPITDLYAALVIDLDGVVFTGDEMIRGAATFLRRGRSELPICFVTNNSSRSVGEWVTLFARHRVQVDAGAIVTSATATAAMLRRTAQGQRVGVLGEYGLLDALRAEQLTLVDDLATAELVVVGLDRGLTYDRLRAAATAIERGARFVVTNPDERIPTSDGHAPGTGATVAFLRAATGVSPEIVGKPMTGLFERARDLLGDPGDVLVVGDQVRTDVVAARAVGWDAALVRTGVDSWLALVDAPATPRWVVDDLSGLDDPAPPVVRHAREQDLSAIRGLLGDAGFDAAGAAERLSSTLVAESEEGHVVGTIAWDLVDAAAHLRGITVAPSERGFGSGAQLVSRALQELAVAGVEWAYVLTPGADALFESLGFWTVHRERVPEEILATAQYGGPASGGTALVRRLPQ